jgi:hypothetical protein
LWEVLVNQALKELFLQVVYSTITQSSILENTVKLEDLLQLEEVAILIMLKMKLLVVKVTVI